MTIGWHFDNTYSKLSNTFKEDIKPTPVHDPELVVLNEKNIKTRDQLADLSNDELIEILVEIDKVKADEIIMDARKHWF